MELSLPLSGSTQAVEAHTTVATTSTRWIALDVFRFAAVLLMVQGHLFTALVSDSVRSQPWYSYHNYVHGFTAPMFLFGAGLAFGITTFRRWEAHAVYGIALRKRLLRYSTLILIGYAIHVPGWNPASLWSVSQPQLARALKVDALQHIGVTLLVCELLVWRLRTRPRFVFTMAVVGVAAVLLGPWAWRLPAEHLLPLPVAAYVNANTGSIFPIVPWAGFVFAGIVTAHYIFKAQQIHQTHSIYPAPGALLSSHSRLPSGASLRAGLALTGAACALLAVLLDRSGLNPFGAHNFWKTSPVFFLWRLGVLLTLLAVLCHIEYVLRDRWPQALNSRAARAIQLMGQESLVVYVAHLLIIYNTFFGFNLARSFGHSLDLGTSMALATGLILAMWLLAWTWRRLHVWQPSFGRNFVLVAALIMCWRGLRTFF